ncbi:MAG: FAD-binding protein [Phycisphaerales bacterium]|nr:FAD-binding protein [Phycisphaerales bacterium]
MPALTVLTEPSRQAVARALANAIEGEVRFGLHDRMLYATDASLYQVEPLGVVIPSSIEDAARAVRFCAQQGLAVLPRGGGTSLAGQAVNSAVVVDLSPNCRALGPVDAQRRLVHAEPGLTIEELNLELARRAAGLFFAPDPATMRQATVGGCIGNNAAGARSILFGRTSENVESIDALLATGERVRLERGAASNSAILRAITERVARVVERVEPLIRERFPRTVRRNAGYGLDLILHMLRGEGAYAGGAGLDNVNLAHLLCGSEGTLAVTLGATLRLQPIPKAKGLAVISFATLDEAMDAVLPILATGPSAVELLDDLVVSLARENAECRRYVELLPRLEGRQVNAVLYVEFFADSCEALAERFAALESVVRALPAPSGPPSWAAYSDALAMLQAWRLRQSGEPLLHGLPGERKPVTFVEDNAIPVERLPEFVRRLRAIVERHGTRAAFYAHASVGVLHVRPLLSLKNDDDLRRLREIAVETADLARELGGVMSGEHGDGRVRGPLLERLYGPELCAAFREIKSIFDPQGILNPGIIVDPGPLESITERLRVDPDPSDGAEPARVPHVETYYTYDDQHGFDGAVEMCNGAGVCRRRSGGTMCPSYQALLDERHATRGRANALRLAITGQLRAGPGGPSRQPRWDDVETMRTLDLCLSCKACKTECPSNVDIARLKAEHHAQRFRSGARVPLAERLMAEVRTLNRLGSLAPGLANAAQSGGLGRRLIGAVMGLHPRRSLPAFAPSLFQWSRRRARTPRRHGPARPRVVLFADCFTTYNEPHIGAAAVRTLEAFGYDVILPRSGCCGRPAMSTGQLPRAIEQASDTLETLAPFIEDPAVAAILVCEPSCLSAFKDDWLTLKIPGDRSLRERLAARSALVEEFLDARWDTHPARPDIARHAGPPVLLHAHCHQKALWGADTSARLLRRAFGERLKVLDTGCCGMAGSFGYAEHRYDLSMRIGELTLFPAVRGAGEGAALAAPGTSCRHQVRDALGAHPLHPIELIAQALPSRD